MQLPLEITYRNIDKSEPLERRIRQHAEKLDRFCDHISSCRIAVEKPQRRQSQGNPFRVRIVVTLPPGREIVARRESADGSLAENRSAVVTGAFAAARRQIRRAVQRQRGQVKAHPEQDLSGVVVRLFRAQGYGFLKTLDEEVYFHRNSVAENGFDRLEVGTGVAFVAVMGEDGPQASSVRIVDKPGTRVSAAEEPQSLPPLGWRK